MSSSNDGSSDLRFGSETLEIDDLHRRLGVSDDSDENIKDDDVDAKLESRSRASERMKAMIEAARSDDDSPFFRLGLTGAALKMHGISDELMEPKNATAAMEAAGMTGKEIRLLPLVEGGSADTFEERQYHRRVFEGDVLRFVEKFENFDFILRQVCIQRAISSRQERDEREVVLLKALLEWSEDILTLFPVHFITKDQLESNKWDTFVEGDKEEEEAKNSMALGIRGIRALNTGIENKIRVKLCNKLSELKKATDALSLAEIALVWSTKFEEMGDTQHWTLAKAHALWDAGKKAEAAQTFRKGITLCEDNDCGKITATVKRTMKKCLDVLTAKVVGPAFSENVDSDMASTSYKDRCWNCNASRNEDFKKCSTCVNKRVATPAWYCSRECQIEDWGRHKLFHKKHEDNADHYLAACKIHGEKPKFHVDDHYGLAIAEGIEAIQRWDFRSARIAFKKAIRIEPDNATAFVNLAALNHMVGNFREMVDNLLETMRLSKRYRSGGLARFWGKAVGQITDLFVFDKNVELYSIEKPPWLEDNKELLSMAERATKCAPDEFISWVSLAVATERAGDYGRSFDCFIKASKLSPVIDVQEEVNRRDKAFWRNEAARVLALKLEAEK